MKTIATIILLMLVTVGFTQETVIIGTQEWMAENLNVGTMVQGSVNQTNNNVIEKYCYGNDEANCAVYGGLYQWNEAMQYTTAEGSQGLCPSGFHIPTFAEITTLYDFLGGINVAGGKLKEVGTAHFQGMYVFLPATNIGATNTSGFTALPGGMRSVNGNFYYIKVDANFWSSSPSPYPNYYLAGGAMYSTVKATNSRFPRNSGLPIRCIKD